MSDPSSTPPGWYHAPGDAPGTQRYWDGQAWQGEPVAVPGGGGTPEPGTASGEMTPFGQRLATPGQRIGARLIDTVIVVVLVVVFLGPLLFDTDSGQISGGVFLLLLVFGFAYEAATVALLGGSPGKLVLGLRVINAENGETPPGWQPGVTRWLPSLVGNLPVIGFIVSLGIFVLSLVWLFNDPKRQTVYDRVAKTQVIQTN